MAFREPAQKCSGLGHHQRKRSTIGRRLRSPPPRPKIIWSAVYPDLVGAARRRFSALTSRFSQFGHSVPLSFARSALPCVLYLFYRSFFSASVSLWQSFSSPSICSPENFASRFHLQNFPHCYSESMPWPTLALDDWKPVSRLGAVICISFYLLFLLYAAAMGPKFLILDFANLMIHEAGHP